VQLLGVWITSNPSYPDKAPELRNCVKVKMAVLGSASLIVVMAFVDISTMKERKREERCRKAWLGVC